MQSKYSHRDKILKLIPLKESKIRAGQIIEFRYSGTNIRDKRPLIMVMANGLTDRNVNTDKILLHGINLNYLSNYELDKLFEILSRNIRGQSRELFQDERDERGRYVSPENSITRMAVPGGIGSAAMTVLRPIMQEVYGSIAKPILSKNNSYRKYEIKNITGVKGIKFKLEVAG